MQSNQLTYKQLIVNKNCILVATNIKKYEAFG